MSQYTIHRPPSSSSSSSSSTSSVPSTIALSSSTSPSTPSPSKPPIDSKLGHQDNNHLPNDIFTLSDQVLAAQYTFESEIGFGNWGSIWRISPNNPSSRAHSSSKLAIKLVHRDKSSGTTATKIKSLWSEFKILRHFKQIPHPNILRVSSFIITPSYALLTMAFHPATLPVRLGERSPRVCRYIKGLLSGTDYLHRHGVSHNDLKPSNVVLSLQDEPILIDFGFAVAYDPDYAENTGKTPFMSTLSWGTPEYLSPQRAKGEEHDERLSDIWSLGVTLYEMVVGRTPFEVDEQEEFLSKDALEVYYQRTLKAEFLGPHTLSTELRQLLKMMLRPDPQERIQSCAEALAHPFFRRPPFDTHIRRRTLERSLPSAALRSPSEPGAGLVNRRMQEFGVRPTSKPSSSSVTVHPNPPNPAINKINITPTKTKAKAVDPQITPRCRSQRTYSTPTNTRLALGSKSVNTPTTPRQRKAPIPTFDLKTSTSVKPLPASPLPTRARAPSSPRSLRAKQGAPTLGSSLSRKPPASRPLAHHPMKEN